MSRVISCAIAIALIALGLGDITRAQTRLQIGDIEAIQVRPNVYMLADAGANILVHIGWMGVVLVDSGSANMSDKVLAAINRLTETKIRFIFNTTADPDHVGGNAALARAGRALLVYNNNPNGGFGGSPFQTQTNNGAAGIMAHENVLNRMSAAVGLDGKQIYPGTGWPTEPFTGARVKSLYLNGDAMQMFYQPAAHSDADSIVVFRRSDVIMAGPIIDLRRFPVIDLKNGGSINGEIAALTRLVDLAVPAAPLVTSGPPEVHR